MSLPVAEQRRLETCASSCLRRTVVDRTFKAAGVFSDILLLHHM